MGRSRSAGGEICGDSVAGHGGVEVGAADDQIGSAAAQGSGAKARADCLTCGNRLQVVGPALIATGQEIDIAGDDAVSFVQRGVEFIGIEPIGMPDVAL